MAHVHELAVTENILALAERYGREAGARRVTDIHLVLGQLSTIVDDSVRFYWGFVSRGSLAEGARLHFRRVPARLHCHDCGSEYGLDGDVLACPGCGGARVEVVAGEEFHMEAIDVDDGSPAAEEAE